jgi:hypothetical protein
VHHRQPPRKKGLPTGKPSKKRKKKRRKNAEKIEKKIFKISLNSLTNIGKKDITEVSMLSALKTRLYRRSYP